MGIIDRLLLLPFALGTAIIALAVIGIIMPIIPKAVWQNELRFVITQKETFIVAVVYLVLSAYFLLRAMFSSSEASTRTHGEHMVLTTDTGEVKLSLSAIKNLMERCASTVQGVHSAETKPILINTENGESLRAEIKLALSSEHQLKQVSEDVSNSIRAELSYVLGLNNVPLDIEVTELSKIASTAKKRVV